MLKKRSTRGNIPTIVDGYKFASKVEARRYLELKSLLNAGTITDLQLQTAFILAPGCVILGRKHSPMIYLADFVYYQDDKKIIEDVKSCRKVKEPKTLKKPRKEPVYFVEPVYALKRHLMKTVLGLDIIEIRYK